MIASRVEVPYPPILQSGSNSEWTRNGLDDSDVVIVVRTVSITLLRLVTSPSMRRFLGMRTNSSILI